MRIKIYHKEGKTPDKNPLFWVLWHSVERPTFVIQRVLINYKIYNEKYQKNRIASSGVPCVGACLMQQG